MGVKSKIILFLLLISLSCSDDDTPVILSSANTITSFSLTINKENFNGIINQDDNTITFDLVNANLNSLKPNIVYSDKAKISPSENISQNFNNEITYTVYAENGDPKVYRVIINNRPLNEENKILSFSVSVNNETIEANINQNNKIIVFNVGSFDKSNLVPNITISENASISPSLNLSQNFNNPVIYKVTAENGGINNYTVVANKPKITRVATIVGIFTNNPVSLYTGADLIISGDFINPELAGIELYLFDGVNKFPLSVSDSSYSESDDYRIIYSLYVNIPKNIPTYSSYKIVYKIGSLVTESEVDVDILAENSPELISLNQNSYVRNDILIITGKNLTDMIAIPSNGSIFLIENSNNYDLTVNPERTEIRLTLDYGYLFPSYFNREEEEKIITIIGPGRRAGETIKTIFK